MKIIITIISKNLATNLFYLLFSVRRNLGSKSSSSILIRKRIRTGEEINTDEN